jgi:hypothetical protein
LQVGYAGDGGGDEEVENSTYKLMKQQFFKTFNDLIFQIAHQFYTWKYLQNSQNNTGYNARSHFWITTISSMQNGFLLNLANIFDKDDRYLSVFSLLDELNNKEVIDEIKSLINEKKYDNAKKALTIWRNNYLAHKKFEFVMDPKKLAEKFPCKYGEIEAIIDLLIYISDKTKRYLDNKNATCYIDYYKELNEQCIKDTQFVLEHGLITPKSI